MVDKAKHCVSILHKHLTHLCHFGAFGSNPGEFKHPTSVATDRAGNIYVSDRDNNRIQQFTEHGNFISQFGEVGNQEIESLEYPQAMAINKITGIVYVSTANRVLIFNTNGLFIGDFFIEVDIHGLAIDEKAELLYIWSYSNKIEVYNTTTLLQQVPLHAAEGAEH